MMNKRVYGILGIVSRMSNWNADFTGYPRTTGNGQVFGSDKAEKYPMKRMWEDQGEKVLYIKSLALDKNNALAPRTLKERYEYLFEIEDLKKQADTKEVLTNLFTAIDVKNFGATFAEEGNNISITGAVQIGQGYNKYKDSEAEEHQILSPFRDPKEKDAKSTTIGMKIFSDEAHYFYPFAINPLVYQPYTAMGVTEGYTEDDYKKFKEAALVAATSFNTNAKLGCENEFALFVETDAQLYLPDLTQYIAFDKEGEKGRITLTCQSLLEDLKDRIKAIEVYYNPLTTLLEKDIPEATYYHLFTGQEVE